MFFIINVLIVEPRVAALRDNRSQHIRVSAKQLTHTRTSRARVVHRDVLIPHQPRPVLCTRAGIYIARNFQR